MTIGTAKLSYGQWDSKYFGVRISYEEWDSKYIRTAKTSGRAVLREFRHTQQTNAQKHPLATAARL